MAIPHWDATAGSWDRLALGTKVLPGVWTVSGVSRRVVDVKRRRGSDGARLKDEGYEPARLSIVGRFVSEEAWSNMQSILPSIHPRRKGGLRKPLYIYHPKAAFLGIESVYIDEISTPEIDNGIVTIAFKAIEWTQQPKKKRGDGSGEQKPEKPAGVDVLAGPPPSLDKLSNVPG